MALTQGQLFCEVCGRPTLHAREHLSDEWGCLLTLLTSGLFLVAWLVIAIFESFKPWRCQICGTVHRT